MVHKLVLTSLLPFLPGAFQMPVGMAVAISYAILILIAQPYFRFAPLAVLRMPGPVILRSCVCERCSGASRPPGFAD